MTGYFVKYIITRGSQISHHKIWSNSIADPDLKNSKKIEILKTSITKESSQSMGYVRESTFLTALLKNCALMLVLSLMKHHNTKILINYLRLQLQFC